MTIRRVLVVAVVLSSFGFAHDEPKGKALTVTGTVVDTGFYMSRDAQGEKHAACARMCANKGVPLAVVDDAGKIYVSIAPFG